MTKEFDLTKPVQTRDGRTARILCTDREGWEWPVVALIKSKTGIEGVCSYLRSGRLKGASESTLDLINVPEKRTLWLNVYTSGSVSSPGHRSKAIASTHAHRTRIACIEITYEEGEGL